MEFKAKNRYIFFLKIITAFLVLTVVGCNFNNVLGVEDEKEEVKRFVQQAFINRNRAILVNDVELIETLYDVENKYGLWAYEHEVKKMNYLHNWEEKQGVKFIEIIPSITIRSVKGSDDVYSINILCSTEYKYVYDNQNKTINSSRIGTYHYMKVIKKDDMWTIRREWYTDPFADSLNIKKLKVDEIKSYILNGEYRDLSSINERRIKAIEYAEQYCGAASEEKYGYTYNKNYRDYNPQGGDCANFASQILHEGGKFRKNSIWNYNKGGATKAWVNAQGFKNYMIGSKRASVIAHGSYEKVYKVSYKLLPGDFVAYEKKGKITHISVVTGADSHGYSLVSCHNTDRNKVPWDLGWSDNGIKFWLVRVHY